MPVQEDGDEVEIDKGDCKLGRILEVYEIQPNNANLGSCGVTFSCTAKPDNSDKTFWIENGKTHRPTYEFGLCRKTCPYSIGLQ